MFVLCKNVYITNYEIVMNGNRRCQSQQNRNQQRYLKEEYKCQQIKQNPIIKGLKLTRAKTSIIKQKSLYKYGQDSNHYQKLSTTQNSNSSAVHSNKNSFMAQNNKGFIKLTSSQKKSSVLQRQKTNSLASNKNSSISIESLQQQCKSKKLAVQQCNRPSYFITPNKTIVQDFKPNIFFKIDTNNSNLQNIKQKVRYNTNQVSTTKKPEQRFENSKVKLKSKFNMLAKINLKEDARTVLSQQSSCDLQTQNFKIQQSFIMERQIIENFVSLNDPVSILNITQFLAFQKNLKILVNIQIFQKQSVLQLQKQLAMLNKINHLGISSIYQHFINKNYYVLVKEAYTQRLSGKLTQSESRKLLEDATQILKYLSQKCVQIGFLECEYFRLVCGSFKLFYMPQVSEISGPISMQQNLCHLKQILNLQ